MLDKIVTTLGGLVVLAFLAWVLSSCTDVDQKLDPEIFYKRDMEISVNGHKITGAGVVPRSGQYEIKGVAKGTLDLFTLTTCHREITREGLDEEFSEKLYPVRGLEDAGGCSLQLGGYERKRGRHSWGFVDFEDAQATLPATLKCNGDVRRNNGVSVCQSRAGLIESIEFDAPVRVRPDPECPIPDSANKKTFVFPLPPKACVFAFREIDPPNRVHRLTTLGYDGILIRED